MEDMARLAVLEQNIRDVNIFSKILRILLDFINTILENPHDYKYRTLKTDSMKHCLNIDTFPDYLRYVGFHLNEDTIVYPKEESLNKLRMAQVSLERKLLFTNGASKESKKNYRSSKIVRNITKKLVPLNALKTNNQFLLHIQNIFNDVLKYEDKSLQEDALDVIPLMSLQMKALDRVRAHQRKIKIGETKDTDLSFDVAQLMELLSWFKYSFFNWVDHPECEKCGGKTMNENIIWKTAEKETCRVEIYRCMSCDGGAEFPRFNDPRTLLRTRRGRCGEWANCFALLARALGYDARYVYDTTDHVWCEVFDYDSNKWLHVDPCEAKLNTPLMYEHGWRKDIEYVIAFSRDDVQDVTWRYSSQHKEVLKRRNKCGEKELLDALMTLRESRQKQLSEPRKRYLAKRCLEELVEIMLERDPSEYESHGRVSGAAAWRRRRGELGRSAHTFQLQHVGVYSVKYHTSSDQYKVTLSDVDCCVINSWSSGAYQCENVFRKEERDWKMVYLAREEGEPTGNISWRLSANVENLKLFSLSVRVSSTLYEDGKIKWSLKFDNEEPIDAILNDTPTIFEKQFRDVEIIAELSGGRGDVAWQHAQLFRQSMDAKTCALEIVAHAKRVTSRAT